MFPPKKQEEMPAAPKGKAPPKAPKKPPAPALMKAQAAALRRPRPSEEEPEGTY